MYSKNINPKRVSILNTINNRTAHIGFLCGTISNLIDAKKLEYIRNLLPRFYTVKGNFIRYIYSNLHNAPLPEALTVKSHLTVYFVYEDMFSVKEAISKVNVKLKPILKELKIKSIVTNLFYFSSDCMSLDLENITFKSQSDLNNYTIQILSYHKQRLVRTLTYNHRQLCLVLTNNNFFN